MKKLQDSFPNNFSSQDLAHFNFAPVTSVDAESSYFSYKYLTDDYRSFNFNIKHALTVQCNKFE